MIDILIGILMTKKQGLHFITVLLDTFLRMQEYEQGNVQIYESACKNTTR